MEVLDIIAVISDVDSICRTCLAEKKQLELHCLYDNALDNMLWKLADLIKPVLGDGLPSYVCEQCIEQLNSALAFKEQCQKAEIRLRHLLLVAPPQKSDITLKELLSTNVENTIKLDKLQTENGGLDVAVQTEKSLVKKRKRRKENQNWSSPYWSSDDELFIDAPNEEEPKLDESEMHSAASVKKPLKPEEKHTSPESKFKCIKCKKVFRSATGLRVHLVKHGKKLKCEVCGKQFGLIKHLNKHMKLHKDYKPYVCKVCKKAFTAAGNLSKHMRVHGGERKHLCITCGRRFFEPGHLAVHMRTHTGEKPIICNVCGKRFADPHGLVAHNKIHTGERNYECKICGKRFAHSFVLTAHIRIHTGEKPYRCSICGASFATSSYLTIHKRTHTQEKPFSCESCPKAFVSRCALVAHNMIHTGEKRFQCNVCGKRVARAADLNIHMRSHTGERPYGCDQCPKRYHTSSNLSAHKRTHLGIKNHVCPICNKAFGDARTLKGHTRIHTGEKPYACQICGNRYSQSGQLAAHRKTHLNQSEHSKPSKHKLQNNQMEVANTNQKIESLIHHNPQLSDTNVHLAGQSSLQHNPMGPPSVLTPVRQLVQIFNPNPQSDQLNQQKMQQATVEQSTILASGQLVPILKIHSDQIQTSNFYAELNPLAPQLKLQQLDQAKPTCHSQVETLPSLSSQHNQLETLSACSQSPNGHQTVHQNENKSTTINVFIE